MSTEVLTLELTAGSTVVLETSTLVVVESDLSTQLDPAGEITLQLLEQSFGLVVEPAIVIELEVPGLQGPPGSPGSGATTFDFVQATPAASWHIVHNLGRYPSVVVLDALGNELLADVIHASANDLTIVHSQPTVGSAHLGT